ncbi:hypothetical protein KFE80_06995 [bacterium SCSIO 12696]|nr:hypothetical protein KFE80_06995 [bacterium SCSIO 12696]
MKPYILKFSLIVLIPFFLSLQILFMYRGHFFAIAEEFSNAAIYTEKAARIESGELVLSQSEIAKLYHSLAKADESISTGAKFMANSTMFYLFGWVAILAFQVVVLIKAYSIIKSNSSTQQKGK